MKKIIVVLFIVLFHTFSWASECYDYHVKTQYELQTKNNEVYLRQNIVDPNGISISQSNKLKLTSNPDEKWKIEGVVDALLFLSNNNAYYLVSAESYKFNEQKPVLVYQKAEVTDRFNHNMFKQNGQWYLVSYDTFNRKLNKKKLTSFPENPTIIAQTENNVYLLKNEKAVYACNFSGEEISIQEIENIDPKTVRFVIPDYYLDAYFLYDHDTFYLTDINIENNEDITSEFRLMEFTCNFTTLEFIKDGLLAGFKDKNNLFWSYVEAGISLENSQYVHFYPIENATLTKNNTLLLANGKYYNNSWNAVYKVEDLDVSQVKNPMALEDFAGSLFYDGHQYYRLNYEKNAFEIVKKLSGSLTSFNPVTSYSYGLPQFFSVENTLYQFQGDKDFKKITTFSGEIKDLNIAYAFNDKLYIDGLLVKSPMNLNNATFVRSIVHVEQPCDGGRGQYPVIVHYYHFFKDASDLYVYSTKTKTLEKLNDTTVATDFDTANQWMQTQIGTKS